MKEQTFKVGPIRPPSESNSLLLRVTENCSWNKCKFCMLYKGDSFRTRPVEEIKGDIDAIALYRDMIMSNYDEKTGLYDTEKINLSYNSLDSYDAKMNYHMVFTWLTTGGANSMFLQDANTIVLRTEWLLDILNHIKEKLPEVERITTYGRADALAKKSLEDLKAIRLAGLNRIHSGYESGSDKVLQLINKGSSQEDELIGGKNVKDAGIELSIYFMPGVGGRELSDENALETAKVINEVNPDFVRLRTFVLRSGSPMEELKLTANYQECSDIEKLLEIRKMIEEIDEKRVQGYLASDHIINLLQDVEGRMDKDKGTMLAYIDSYLALPEYEQKRFQLARRMGFSLSWDQLDKMRREDLDNIDNRIKANKNEEDWERLLHRYMNRYI